MAETAENKRRAGSQVIAVWLIRVLAVFCVAGTLIPLLPTGAWYVRGWDFPRFQLAYLSLGVLLLICVFRRAFRSRRELALWLIVLAPACLWDWSYIVPFTPVWPKEVPPARESANAMRLLVVNLKYENRQHAAVEESIRALNPDLLILIEVNEEWSRGLAGLRKEFPAHHDEPRDEGLGLCLWSKFPLQHAETRFLVEDRRPSIWATVSHQGDTLQLVAVHPTPPGLDDSTGPERRDSRARDAELVLVAREVTKRPKESWIVAGDFNDVAWSHTTRLFQRLSGLSDPRIGRHFLGTYHADYPLLRFPIDHVFVSEGLAVAEMSRHEMPGSDHFAILATLTVINPTVGVEPKPEGNDHEDAREILQEGKQEAAERGISADE